MPGEISDAYDPEFGTAANAHAVGHAVRDMRQRITDLIGADLLPIVGVVRGLDGATHHCRLTERELRIIRFALGRALDSL